MGGAGGEAMKRGRDPFVALLLEVVGGFFGFLGIGWIYAGRPVKGVVLLLGYWLLDWIVGLVLSFATLGVWCFIWPAQNLVLGAISGYLAYRWLERQD
jgi:TM2 domain-containing membrane protein YozV